MRRFLLPFLLVVVPLLASCAGRHFDAARAEDTPSAYHRFLRDHPGSRYEDEARQRLEIARIRHAPSVAAWRAFAEEWPGSALADEARSLVEETAFLGARIAGTAAAWREFLADFGDGAFATRARGNLAYLESAGLGGDAAKLLAFARAHPESDHAAEARRSAASAAARERTAFQRVGLRIELAAGTPGPEVLAQLYRERAEIAFAGSGVQLIPLRGANDPRAADLPAQVVVRHREGQVGVEQSEGEIVGGGLIAETVVTVENQGRTVWSNTLRFRPPGPSARPDASVLLGVGTEKYWSSFFVPMLSWSTDRAVRKPAELEREVVAVAARGTQALALEADGSFRVLDLSDPEAPWLAAEYRRPRDLQRFAGIASVGERVAIFGEDGVEFVRLGVDGATLESKLGRDEIGSVLGLEAVGGRVLAAGSQGLQLLPAEPDGELERLAAGPLEALAVTGDWVVFARAGQLFASRFDELRGGRTESLDLGRGVALERLRSTDSGVAVLTDRGPFWLALSEGAPRLVARVDAARVGRLADAVVRAGRVLTVGPRGFQVVDARRGRVEASADVSAQQHMAPMGRHLVLAGGRQLQVVDLTPFLPQGAAASVSP